MKTAPLAFGICVIAIASSALSAQDWKPYNSVREVCGGLDGTIVTLKNQQILKNRENAEAIKQVERTGEGSGKATQDLLSMSAEFDRLILVEAELWNKLDCAQILYGRAAR